MKFLDLFAGLGGASQAFVDSPSWEVLRIDNNPLLSEVEHMWIDEMIHVRDILRREQHMLDDIDVVWASPPCTDFSVAYNAPRAVAQRNKVEYEPSLELLEITLEIISIINPRYWIIENVRGSMTYFRDLLGEPRQIHDAYVLWGNYPTFTPEPFPPKADKDDRHSPLRSNVRARIPIQISKALLDAIENQKTLFDYV
jgi:hypothetical protein